jgi:hypothetical protein
VTTEVDVLDWTGTPRYHFQVSAQDGTATTGGIESISPDGTRALLDDGTVIDQSGRTVGDLPGVGSLLTSSQDEFYDPVAVRWLSDDSGVCLAGPTQLLGGSTSTGQMATGTTVEVVNLDGATRIVATLATGQTSLDEISVDACNPATNTATIAVFGGQSNAFANSTPDFTGPETVGIWSVRLSTGNLLYRQTPTARLDRGQPWSIGSGDGSLAVEFVGSCELTDYGAIDVVSMPRAGLVPIATHPTCAEVPALSADGTRFLVTDFDASDSQSTLDLVDASDGTVVRSFGVGSYGVTAVPSPDGADFMVLVDGHLVLVDRNGGVTQLHPAAAALGGAATAGLLTTFGFAGLPPVYTQG